MAREKIYVPVDPADIIQVAPAPRELPAYVVEKARRADRRALTLVSAAAGGALAGALLGGATAVLALILCVALALGGLWLRQSGRWLVRVARDGQTVAAKVCIDLGQGLTEVKYAPEERDVSFSGNLAVFAGDPKRAHVRMDYEYAGRIYSVAKRVVGEGKPAAVRVGQKVSCAVLVHANHPGKPMLVTQKMAKAVNHA